MSSKGGGTRMGSFSGGIGYAYPLEDDTSYNDQTSYSSGSALNNSRQNINPKAVYELAQQSSSRQVGSTLYSSGGNNVGRRRPNRALRFQNKNHNDSQRSSMSSAHSSFQPSFSMNSSHNNNNNNMTTTSSFVSSSAQTSMSGNPLTQIDRNDLPEQLELDKDELKQMIIPSHDSDSNSYAGRDTINNESVAISTNNESVITPLTPSSHYDTHYTPSNKLLQQLLKITQSTSFRRSLFLSTLLLLMAIGTFLTIENIIHVKDANAWIEPPSSNTQTGIHWTMGSDAPKPIMGISNNISPLIQDYIADWAIGTQYLPGIIDNYGSITLTDTTRFRDVPLFWGSEYADFQGRGGGSSVMEGVLGCLNLVQVSAEGVMEEDGKDNEKDGNVGDEGGGERPGGDYLHLSVVMAKGRKYVNVDTTTKEGIERANVLALGSSGMADVIYTSLLQDVSSLFTTLNQGRMFVLVRHPVEREMARFRYLRRGQYDRTKLNDWQRGNLQDMSYEEYAKSEFARDNWMTRELVNKRCIDGKGEDGRTCAVLEDKDLYTAKEILRRKALIGLYSDIMGAVQHYGRYFGWDSAQKGGRFDDATMFCFQNHVLEGMRKDALGGKDLDPNDALEHSDAYVALMEKNGFDFELFTYAQTLYKYQVELS